MEAERWVYVTFPLPLQRAFTYRLPAALAPKNPLGHRVVVPFGRRLAIGIITGIASSAPRSGGKDILFFPDENPLFLPHHLAFLEWMSTYYLCSLGQILRVAMAPIKACYQVRLSLRRSSVLRDNSLVSQSFVQVLEEKGTLTYAQAAAYLPHEELLACIKKLLAQDALSLCGPNYAEEVQISLADRYFSAQGEVLVDDLSQDIKTPAQKRLRDVYGNLMEALKQRWVPSAMLVERGISSQLITRACKTAVWVSGRAPFRYLPYSDDKELLPTLTEVEKKVIEAIRPDRWEGKRVASVQAGDGTYEVLCRALAVETLQREETSVWLVPNLEALAFWQERLASILGERLIVWSSQQTLDERKRVWYRLEQRPSAFILAMPSILVYPFSQLDRIIVTEESSDDYKQVSSPRYHARDVAIMCAQHHRAKVLLTSATPSLETYHNVEKGKYIALTLPSLHRAHPPTPSLHILTRPRHHPVLTTPIVERLQSAFTQKKKVVLLHPRRGYTAYTSCKQCGWQATCSVCTKGLVYHQKSGRLHCHHCQHSSAIPVCCPTCQGSQLQYSRVGTQQVEETLSLHFPRLRVARVDRDEVPYQKKYRETLQAFKRGQLDCLVGTQRLLRAVGHLDPDLLVWIDSHSWTSQTNFRATVRQRYLLEKLLRHRTADELLILLPERHRDIVKHLKQERDFFYRDTLQSCKEHGYPPYVKFVKIIIRHRSAVIVTQAAEALATLLESQLQLTVLGPIPIQFTQKGYVESALWVKLTRQKVKAALYDCVQTFVRQRVYRQVGIYFDVDPID